MDAGRRAPPARPTPAARKGGRGLLLGLPIAPTRTSRRATCPTAGSRMPGYIRPFDATVVSRLAQTRRGEPGQS